MFEVALQFQSSENYEIRVTFHSKYKDHIKLLKIDQLQKENDIKTSSPNFHIQNQIILPAYTYESIWVKSL